MAWSGSASRPAAGSQRENELAAERQASKELRDALEAAKGAEEARAAGRNKVDIVAVEAVPAKATPAPKDSAASAGDVAASAAVDATPVRRAAGATPLVGRGDATALRARLRSQEEEARQFMAAADAAVTENRALKRKTAQLATKIKFLQQQLEKARVSLQGWNHRC